MTDETPLAVLLIVTCIWIGWPLHSIAASLTKLVRMAERNRK